jgi:iron complex outermembrane receptor protein
MGVTGPIMRTLMGRFDASYSDGGGFAKPSSTKLRAMAGSLWWTPTSAISIKANGKYTDDKVNAYYGTPFINGQVDPRMRFINYNLADAFSKAHNNFGRVDTDIALPNGWRFHNGTFGATQRLDYRNMESYAYNPATQKVDISTYFLIWRHDLLAGNQTDVRKTVDVLGRSVNFIMGFEAQRNHFERAKNPANSTTVRFSVDPFHPAPIYDPKLPYLRVPDVIVNNRTFYAEAQAKIASRWTSVLGLRTEGISVDYGLVVGGDQMVNRTYHPTTGRAGLVFTATDNVSLYSSYSRSVEPATQFVSLSGCCGSATDFNLTPARQFEAGAKGTAVRAASKELSRTSTS